MFTFDEFKAKLEEVFGLEFDHCVECDLHYPNTERHKCSDSPSKGSSKPTNSSLSVLDRNKGFHSGESLLGGLVNRPMGSGPVDRRRPTR